jgi:hypothetical protein
MSCGLAGGYRRFRGTYQLRREEIGNHLSKKRIFVMFKGGGKKTFRGAALCTIRQFPSNECQKRFNQPRLYQFIARFFIILFALYK